MALIGEYNYFQTTAQTVYVCSHRLSLEINESSRYFYLSTYQRSQSQRFIFKCEPLGSSGGFFAEALFLFDVSSCFVRVTTLHQLCIGALNTNTGLVFFTAACNSALFVPVCPAWAKACLCGTACAHIIFMWPQGFFFVILNKNRTNNTTSYFSNQLLL